MRALLNRVFLTFVTFVLFCFVFIRFVEQGAWARFARIKQKKGRFAPLNPLFPLFPPVKTSLPQISFPSTELRLSCRGQKCDNERVNKWVYQVYAPLVYVALSRQFRRWKQRALEISVLLPISITGKPRFPTGCCIAPGQ